MMKIKVALKKWLWDKFCMHKWLWPDEMSHKIKRERKIPKNITSKDNQQDQDVGSILIMSG